MLVDQRQCVRRAAVQQIRRRVQPLGIFELGQVEAKFRKQLRRRQAITNEGVVHPSSSPAFAGEGDQRSWWKGSSDAAKTPSTAFGGPPPHEIAGRMIRRRSHSSTTAVVSIS